MKLRLEAARQLEVKGKDGATLLSNRCQFSSCCCASCRASFVFPFSHLRRFLPFRLLFCLARISVLFSCRPSPFPATSNNPPLSLWSFSWTTAPSRTHGSMLRRKSWEPRLVTRNQGWGWSEGRGGEERNNGESEDKRWTVWWRGAGEHTVGRSDAERCLKRQSRWLKQKVKWKKGSGSMNKGMGGCEWRGQGELRMRWAIRAVLQEVSGNAARSRGRNSERRINTCPPNL